MYHTSRLSLALLFVACLFGSAFSVCYLDPSVTAAGHNCTVTDPCLTINECLTKITPADTSYTISLASGTYGSDNCGVSPTNSLLQNVTNLSIVGNATTSRSVFIDCAVSNQNHLTFANLNVALSVSYISFRNGHGDSGGCISVDSVAGFTVSNADFTGCSSYTGGAIYTSNTTTIISNSTFTGNNAALPPQGTGGALYLSNGENKTTIVNCVFRNNNAMSGGAIYFVGDNLALTISDISLNTASISGGGVVLYSLDPTHVGTYNFQGTSVYNNTAVNGGGLFSQNLDHDWNVFGAAFVTNIARNNESTDSNVACGNSTSPFCSSCKAKDCSSDCAINSDQSCSQTSDSVFCYSSKMNKCKAGDCKCKASLSTVAKLLLVMICLCLLSGIVLLVIGFVRFLIQRRSKNSYTPIK